MIGNSLRATAGRVGKRKLLATAAVIGLAAGVMGGAFAGVGVGAPDGAAEHCVVSLEPLRPGQLASEMSAVVCFDTFEEALESIGADPDDFQAR